MVRVGVQSSYNSTFAFQVDKVRISFSPQIAPLTPPPHITSPDSSVIEKKHVDSNVQKWKQVLIK